MAGKITYKKGRHPSREAHWGVSVGVTAADWARLERILERQLTADERERIQSGLDAYASYRTVDREIGRPTMQDIKATLAAIAKESDENIHQTIKHCDSGSRAILSTALHQMGECIEGLHSLKPAKLRAAAAIAPQYLPDSTGGKPLEGCRILFCKWLVELLWPALGRSDLNISASDDHNTASPLVRFAAALLAILTGESLGYSAVAKTLRKVTS